MDLLSVSNEINSELGALRKSVSGIVDDQQRADIFNAVIVSISNDLLDGVIFTVRDKLRNEAQQTWQYDLGDRQYVKRRGPDIDEIIAQLETTGKEMYLECAPVWSQKYHQLEAGGLDKLLKGTIWSSGDQQRRQSLIGTSAQKPIERPRFDLIDLEDELRNILIELGGAYDVRHVEQIIKSIIYGLEHGTIIGVTLKTAVSVREEIVLRFTLDKKGSVTRERPFSIYEQLRNGKILKNAVKFTVSPIPSQNFSKMSPEDQHEAMKQTIWGAFYPKPKLWGIF
ncbi:MAG: hypothetical protein QY328_17345 [Anaerolineales bacterium]|nr:MAG: hypothetical protein QY328_17345 [Anaerolineales bacterium]